MFAISFPSFTVSNHSSVQCRRKKNRWTHGVMPRKCTENIGVSPFDHQKEYGFNAISWDILINKASSFFIWK